MSRKIDVLIAEHVMGLEVCESPPVAPCYVDYGVGVDGVDGWLPHYSTNIAAAWEVVERFHSAGIRVDTGLDGKGNRYRVRIITRNITQRAKTAPMAICLAALKAKGIEVEDGY